MLLFLDVISPLPEFFIIEDNKVILKRKIVSNETDNLSDNIFQTYINIDNNLNLTQNLKEIVLTIGPGSYTSLRIGAAFVSGLKISRDLSCSKISVSDVLKFNSISTELEKTGIYIISAKKQKFFCIYNIHKQIEFIKIDDNNFIPPKNIKTIFYNVEKYKFQKKIKQFKFSFTDVILKNYKGLKFTKKDFINPIYVSNNKLLS
tara:strand:+ start:8 stop:619 length:612 start_codon:yes stop_codon:yes gene_type:complete